MYIGTHYNNWSIIGSLAKGLSQQPTIGFNFTNMEDDEIKTTIVHQFGHALGLGHALMKPEDWDTLKNNMKLEQMMSDCHASNVVDLRKQWTGKGLKENLVHYDDLSVMLYRQVLFPPAPSTFITFLHIERDT